MNYEKIMTLYGENTALLEELYENYTKNPSSVSNDWQVFFKEVENGVSYNGKSSSKPNPFQDVNASSLQEMGIINLLNAYRRQGHLAANLDPLGISKQDRSFIDQKLRHLGNDYLETEVETGNPTLGKTKLKNVVDWYEKTYCGPIGCEQYYLVNEEEREWLQQKWNSLEILISYPKTLD